MLDQSKRGLHLNTEDVLLASRRIGELCNILKKIKRGSKKWDKSTKKECSHEIADTISYLALLASLLEIDMGDALIEKFNIVSKRWKNCPVRL
jgi:NTP pyrophosphatase (non-canonical NTP hydrolase)